MTSNNWKVLNLSIEWSSTSLWCLNLLLIKKSISNKIGRFHFGRSENYSCCSPCGTNLEKHALTCCPAATEHLGDFLLRLHSDGLYFFITVVPRRPQTWEAFPCINKHDGLFPIQGNTARSHLWSVTWFERPISSRFDRYGAKWFEEFAEQVVRSKLRPKSSSMTSFWSIDATEVGSMVEKTIETMEFLLIIPTFNHHSFHGATPCLFLLQQFPCTG